MPGGFGTKWGDQLRLSSLGLVVALSVAIGAVGGWWLDDHFGTDPWFTAGGVILGSVAGFYELFRETRRPPRQDD